MPRDSRDNLADNLDEDEDYDLPRPSGKSFIAEESSEDEYDLPRPSSQSLLDDDVSFKGNSPISNNLYGILEPF